MDLQFKFQQELFLLEIVFHFLYNHQITPIKLTNPIKPINQNEMSTVQNIKPPAQHVNNIVEVERENVVNNYNEIISMLPDCPSTYVIFVMNPKQSY